MEMRNRLAGIGTAVGNEAVAVHEPCLFGDGGDRFEDVCHHGAVRGGDAVEGGNMGFGDHQDVNGGLRVDVAECQNAFVLIYFGGGNVAGCDFAEQTHRKIPSFRDAREIFAVCFSGKLDKCMTLRYNVDTNTVIIAKRRISVNGSNERFDHRRRS